MAIAMAGGLPALGVAEGAQIETIAALSHSSLNEGDLNLEIVEIPIGALGGQQIFKAKGVVSQHFHMLAAIGAGAAAKGEDFAIGIDQHGGIESRLSRRHVPGDRAAG